MVTSQAVSIIIPCHNRREDVLGLLDSLARECAPADDVEVIVIDDASTDGLVDAVQETHPSVRTLRNDTNQGPAATRNRAAREANGRLLLFLDSDGEVGEGWLAVMRAADDGNTVLLGNVVDLEGGRVQSVPRRATFLGKSLSSTPERANSGPSCNLGIPKARFEELGGFDEEIPYYFEDSDLCIRARKSGCAFRFLPEAVFRHKGTEHKRGDAVRMQERNSTYAMLKAYSDNPPALLAFTLLNTAWALTKTAIFLLRGRGGDAARHLRGHQQGWAAYLRRGRN